jgi:hypothetical protein
MNFRRESNADCRGPEQIRHSLDAGHTDQNSGRSFMEISVLERSSVAAGFYPRFISAALPAIS